MPTDERLERLLREANINVREKLKKKSSAKVVKIFHKHPRNFDESDLLGDPNFEFTDSDENDKSDREINIKPSKYIVDRYSKNLKFSKVQERVKVF